MNVPALINLLIELGFPAGKEALSFQSTAFYLIHPSLSPSWVSKKLEALNSKPPSLNLDSILFAFCQLICFFSVVVFCCCFLLLSSSDLIYLYSNCWYCTVFELLYSEDSPGVNLFTVIIYFYWMLHQELGWLQPTPNTNLYEKALYLRSAEIFDIKLKKSSSL